ncbi:MAG: hypothetical protein QM736_25635 [Vicinamibacterales bacterium]
MTRVEPANDPREIFGWLMYDWANSAFITTVITVLAGPYLTALAQADVSENGVVLALGPLVVTAKSLFPIMRVGIRAAAGAPAANPRSGGGLHQSEEAAHGRLLRRRRRRHVPVVLRRRHAGTSRVVRC